ncbi:hypothetical protein [Streptomyces sp. NPDC048442]|uniref:hypothetical protein n=1 Tax=Streptomyces sp. NPDC048442 TaxID=3154823 RepID=UPI00343B698E
MALGSGRAMAHRDELARLAENLLSEPTVRNLWRRQLSLTRIFDWLEGFPADTWQDRWLLSGSDDLGSDCGARYKRRWGSWPMRDGSTTSHDSASHGTTRSPTCGTGRR